MMLAGAKGKSDTVTLLSKCVDIDAFGGLRCGTLKRGIESNWAATVAAESKTDTKSVLTASSTPKPARRHTPATPGVGLVAVAAAAHPMGMQSISRSVRSANASRATHFIASSRKKPSYALLKFRAGAEFE